VDKTRYLEGFPPEETEDAAEVVNNFVGYAHQFDKVTPGGDLRGFLQEAALVSDVDGWNPAAAAVPFMTLHSAKGLEFEGKYEAIEEERRLLHVGMTRARRLLFLSYCRSRFAQGRERITLPSRFLAELPSDCVEKHVGRFVNRRERSAMDFAKDMSLALEAKRRIKPGENADWHGELEPGGRVNHPRFGQGEISQVKTLGEMYLLEVNFEGRGPMTILLPRKED